MTATAGKPRVICPRCGRPTKPQAGVIRLHNVPGRDGQRCHAEESADRARRDPRHTGNRIADRGVERPNPNQPTEGPA